MVRRRGAALWGGTRAQQCGAAQGRSSVGLRRGAAWGLGGVQQRGAAQGRNAGLRRGAPWGYAGAQRGVAHGRSSVGRRRGVAVWGCAGAQQRGAAAGERQHGGTVGARRARWGGGGAVGWWVHVRARGTGVR